MRREKYVTPTHLKKKKCIEYFYKKQTNPQTQKHTHTKFIYFSNFNWCMLMQNDKYVILNNIMKRIFIERWAKNKILNEC